MTKSELTKRIKATVKGLYLNCIINQTDKAKRKQEKNNPDYFIYGRGWVIFLEAKIGKDKLSDGQETMIRELTYASKFNNQMFVSVITDSNYEEVLNKIIKNLTYNYE
jgi:hypothetical protein